MKFKRIIPLLLAISMLFGCFAVLGVGVAADEAVLSEGKSYTVEYETPIDNAFPARAYKEENKLTDGKLAKNATYNEPEFLKLYRGMAAYVTIDLGKVCSVSGAEVHFLQHKAAGIFAPRYIKVAVSEDGENFGTVGVLEDSNTITRGAPQILSMQVKLDEAYKARYVRLMISCDTYLYCDEVRVFGSEEAGSAKTAKADAPVEDRGFAGQIDGIGNVVLMYTYAKYSSSVLKPFVEYTDEAGNKDRMFDAMLFLPSGASGFNYSTDKGWQDYIDELFGEATSSNLSALEQTVAEVISDLNLDADFKYPVFISLPDFSNALTSTGTLYGFRPNTLDNRTAVVKAFIDQVLERFASLSFEHVELKGFYWHEETIRYSISNYEEELIKNFNQYVHEKGYKSIWIPYYCASGYERAVDLGFDAATLQSGYAFKRDNAEVGEVQAGAVSDSAATAKRYGLGMEFELDIHVTDFLKRYLQYLTIGYKTGCMDGHMMMLYHGTLNLYNCATAGASTDLRQVYDLTYQYIKGTFTSMAPTIAPGQVIVAPTGKRQSGNLVITDPDSGKAALKIANTVYSEGLTCVVEGDGFYLINTSNTQPGAYSIVLQVTDGYNLSEEETIYVVVTDKEPSMKPYQAGKDLELFASLAPDAEKRSATADTSFVAYYKVNDDWFYAMDASGEIAGFVKTTEFNPPESEKDSESSADEGDVSKTETSGAPNWIIFVICGVAVVVIAVIAVLIVKKRKK